MRRKQEMRERILRAALRLFAQQGFFATTVEQITEAADVGKGTFFNYFPTKEHALAGFGEMQYAKVQAALREVRAGKKPALTALRQVVRSLSEEPGRSQALVRNLMFANLSSEPVRKHFRVNLGKGRRGLAELFAHAQRRGEIRRGRSPAELARLFQKMFLGSLLLWAIHPPSKLTGWLGPTFDFFWSNIAAKKGSR